MKAQWYFDVISPFAYLQMEILPTLADKLEIEFQPILLAGLLNHWGHLGPAEIPAKRIHTYRFAKWLAKKHGSKLDMPVAHPFNPLPLLRAALLAGNDYAAIKRIFQFVWVEGKLPQDEEALGALLAELRIGRERLEEPDTKQRLKDNTQRAIAKGVFGVPTFVVNDQLFWGFDATEMLEDYLRNPALFDERDMQRINDLPQAASRIK